MFENEMKRLEIFTFVLCGVWSLVDVWKSVEAERSIAEEVFSITVRVGGCCWLDVSRKCWLYERGGCRWLDEEWLLDDEGRSSEVSFIFAVVPVELAMVNEPIDDLLRGIANRWNVLAIVERISISCFFLPTCIKGESFGVDIWSRLLIPVRTHTHALFACRRCLQDKWSIDCPVSWFYGDIIRIGKSKTHERTSEEEKWKQNDDLKIDCNAWSKKKKQRMK